MLEIVPKSWFSWDFRVLDGGRELTVIDRAWLRERGTFVVDGLQYEVRRTALTRSTFALEQGGVLIAEATKPSAFLRSFEMTAGREYYTLKAASPFRREFQLYRDTTLLGSIRPNSVLGRSATVSLSESVPLPLRLFTVFLVLILWKRASDAAAAS